MDHHGKQRTGNDPAPGFISLPNSSESSAHPLLVSREVNGQTKYQVEIGPFVIQEEAMDAGTLLGEKYSDSLNCPWGNCNWQYTWRGSPPKLLCNDPGRPCQPDG